ncbi:PorP/SprF family type IX secretion system membrane protein [Chondrinema litorale]|uniref:PorP/SprF family type IX secretion system membrane protein n=1 Tax=Chondrinema litorale TaxID=2994555 RepID=UPI002543714B|nr:type IX secretion system membrane protein PorP/SprF [Chondrinema litorale]UZR92782.1 type IX secretion system membrane protein PorP/SprF [Chondrinema litorale]
MNRSKIYFLTLVVNFFLATDFLHAQQDAQFSQYMFNQLYLNPAAAGINTRQIEFSVIHRSQWLGYEGSFDDGGAPTTQVASISMPFEKYNLGVGLHFVNDKIGPVTNQEAQLSLAYQIKVSRGIIAIGVRGGFYNQQLNVDELRFTDPVNEPLYQQLSGRESQMVSDFGAGIYYKDVNDKFFTGMSISHLNRSNFNYGTNISFNELESHYTFLAGVNLDLTRTVKLTPSAIVKSDMNTFSIESSVIATFNEKFYTGLSMRELEAAIAIVGVNLLKDKSLRLGYAFDYTLKAQNAKETTSHEILLSYKIPALQVFEPSIIRTPRFRFE